MKNRILDDFPSDEEDEDEETLQLKLQVIQAQLKLKKLQQAKAKQSGGVESGNESTQTSSRSRTSASLRQAEPPRPRETVQVPLSPTQDRRAPQEHKSPAKLLGIDKGLRAQDVSLKRAPSVRNGGSGSAGNPSMLSRSNSLRTPATSSRNYQDIPSQRPQTFNERMAAQRLSEKERQEKAERIEKARSRGFGITQNDLGGFQDVISSRTSSQQSFNSRQGANSSASRSSVLPPAERSTAKSLHTNRSLAATSDTPRRTFTSNSATYSSLSQTSRTPSQASFSSRTTASALNSPSVNTASASRSPTKPSSAKTSDSTTVFEPFSGFHLTKRLLPHTTLTRTLDSRTLFTIPQLLKEVKGPHYDPPDLESDYVVVGIIASKSTPLTHKTQRHTASSNDDEADAGRSKFMVLRLTDLKWEIDLYLFDTGFSTFWKLTIGSVVAILNPDIMPPRNRDTGAFSLKLTSSDDTVLEIGMARDLGFCKAIKKDGKECAQWIDGRKTEFCEWHVSLQVEKAKRGRMEVNTMTGWGGGGARKTGKFGMFGGGTGVGKGQSKEDGLVREGIFRDRSIHETMYIAPGARPNAAKLLDEEDLGVDWRGSGKAEAQRKRFAEKEKERELAKKLGEIGGGGIGGEYMRLKGMDKPATSSDANDGLWESVGAETQEPAKPDAAALGLLGKKASDISLSPVKRKRSETVVKESSAPMGWSGAFKRGLLSPKKKETPEREISPVKKKARFILDKKGIREPGRESLGNVAEPDDDDDGLDII